MDDELELTADQVVPEPEITAPPETVDAPPEVDEAPKTFTQEELDAQIGKRLARERRKWEREQTSQPAAKAPADYPSREDFADEDSFTDAVGEYKADQKLRQRDAVRIQAEFDEGHAEREEAARVKYDDYEQVAYNPNLPITDFMAQTIKSSDIGPDIIYHLGTEPKEAARISRLPPLLQVREIGKLEAKLADNPPVKRTSTAPAPIAPVTPNANGKRVFDTTDPRSIDSMSTSEWIAAEEQRQIKRAEARNNR